MFKLFSQTILHWNLNTLLDRLILSKESFALTNFLRDAENSSVLWNLVNLTDVQTQWSFYVRVTCAFTEVFTEVKD